MNNLAGVVAWVTGGGTGVGAAIAGALAVAGASVIVSGRTSSTLERIADKSTSISSFTCDVTDPPGLAACVEHIASNFGALDIVVANAGVATSAPFLLTRMEALQSMLDINVVGVFNTWQSALPLVKDSSRGRLITIASTAGIKGYAYVSGYCASKHAVVGLTRSLAAELAESNVTVNAVCPGYVNTSLLDRTLENIVEKTGCSLKQAESALKKTNPQGRFIEPDEVASAVLWICGDQSSAITGQTIQISGGEV